MLMRKRQDDPLAASRNPAASRPPAAVEEATSDTAPTGLLERTLGVLELLSAHAHGLHLSEISERLRVPASATHRVLASLIDHGYVRQQRNHGAYCLTAKIASLAFTFLAGSGVTDLAQPIMDRVAREAGELVRLAMVDGRQLVWVAKAQGMAHGLRYDPDMGQVGHLSCSASGHAWLSCLPDDEAIALVERQGYGARRDFGPKAPQTREAVLRYLRQARKRGYALAVQTYSPWMNAVAAPIRHQAGGEVIGTLVIAGPEMRLTEDKMHGLAPLLIEASGELAIAMMASPSLYGRAGRASTFFATGS